MTEVRFPWERMLDEAGIPWADLSPGERAAIVVQWKQGEALDSIHLSIAELIEEVRRLDHRREFVFERAAYALQAAIVARLSPGPLLRLRATVGLWWWKVSDRARRAWAEFLDVLVPARIPVRDLPVPPEDPVVTFSGTEDR